MTIQEAKTKKHQYEARFVKKDGTVRAIRFRTDVKSEGDGQLAYSPTEKGLKLVWDSDAKGWRMINVYTVYELTIKGKTYLNDNAKNQLINL
jgi:hypothetical protein